MRKFPTQFKVLVSNLLKITPKDHGLVSLIAQSDLHTRMTKKSRADKSPPPEWSKGLISLTRSTVHIKPKAGSYGSAINNHLAKNEMNPNFVAEESKISRPIEDFPNEVLREGVKDADKLYVRIYIDVMPSKVEMYYLNDKNEDVTHLVTKDFKDNFLPKKSGSQKQAEHGVSKELKPREYKAQNIIYFQRGEVIFNNLSQDLMEKFNLV